MMSRIPGGPARLLAAVFTFLALLPPGLNGVPRAEAQVPTPPRVAFVHAEDVATAGAFKASLESRGIAVDLVSVIAVGPLPAPAETYDYSKVQAILIGDDTGNDESSPAPAWEGSTLAFSLMNRAEKYTIGFGRGGSLFFQLRGLNIGFGAPFPAVPVASTGATALNPGDLLWTTPKNVPIPPDAHVKLYNQNTPMYVIDHGAADPDIVHIGRETEAAGKPRFPLISERFLGQTGFYCNMLWGFRRGPTVMTVAGQDFLENVVRGNPCRGRVAYIYDLTISAADAAFQSLLIDRGLAVDMVAMRTLAGPRPVETFSFAPHLAIIVGHDTGNTDAWGTVAGRNNVKNSGKPIVGLGEGGYAFFGRPELALQIGFPNGSHGPADGMIVVDESHSIYDAPLLLPYLPSNTSVALYTAPMNTVQIFSDGAPPAGITRIGRSRLVNSPNHYPLISSRGPNQCFTLWGWDGSPSTMRPYTKDLFINTLLGKPCATDTVATSADLSITKSSSPSSVYRDSPLTYQLVVKNNGPDAAQNVKVIDTLPASVTFGSASPSQGTCSVMTGTVACNLGVMAALGAFATVQIVVTPTVGGPITNTAKVMASTPDPSGANNTAVKVVDVKTPFVLPPVYAVPWQSPFLDLPILDVVQPDYSIFGIEITQGIQCFDTGNGLAGCANNSLPVVTKKETTARIYLRYNNAPNPGSTRFNVPVRLHIFANGVEYTANANGTARTSIDQSNPDSADIYFNVNFSNDIPVSFYAVVDPNNTVAETNESNNRFPASGTIDLNFRRRAGPFKVVGQRLKYHPSGYSGTQNAGGWAVNGGAADWLEQLLPLRNNGFNYSVASGYLDWTTTLGGSPSGQHALIQRLNSDFIIQTVFNALFGTSGPYVGARHVYGWAPNQGYSGGHADMPIYDHAGGLGVVAIGTDRVSDGSSTVDDPGGGALIFGHELVHDYDVLHTDTADACGSDDDDSTFPYPSSSIQEFGYNPITGKIYTPSTTHDLMSYCPAGDSKQGWISPFTWNTMFNRYAPSISRRTVSANASGSLAVTLSVSNPAAGAQTGSFGDLFRLDTIAPPTQMPVGEYKVELRSITGTVLAAYPFAVSFESEYHGGTGQVFDPADTPAVSKSFVMPWFEEAKTIVLLRGTTELTSRTVSPGSPVVNITSPSASVSWTAGTTQTLTWTGSDPDGDPLRYSVYFSNNGSEWELLATGLTVTSFEIPVDSIKGGANTKLRVVATDGVNTGQDETDAPISVPDKAPFAAISNPLPNIVVRPGNLLVFAGFGNDFEDGTLPDYSLIWSSDRQGIFGTGPSVPMNTLLFGEHQITLFVTDSAGQTTITTTTVFVGYRMNLPVIQK